MAEGDIVIYNDFKEQILSGTHNLASGGNTIKITLHTSYTPNIDTHQVWADTGVSSTEYGTASGYTAGGKTLGSQTVTQDDSGDRALFDGADVTWTALGALSPATPSHAIIWNDTPTSPADPLIAYVELGTTATNGGDYTISWSASPAAILSLT
jgi:hypothetical protein